jgi:hypothetical protein
VSNVWSASSSHFSLMHNRLKYSFEFDPITPEKFLNWKSNEVTKITVRTRTKVRNKASSKNNQGKTVEIPFLYVQLIAQLNAENDHGDRDSGHESLRRQSYVRDILNHVAKELKTVKEPTRRFRSKVLNPILQRYLRGIPDCYTPSIRAAIADDGQPTIADVTRFYLSEDPVSPKHMDRYRRNLVYLTELRWYLGVVLETIAIGDAEAFNKIRTNHDKIMTAVAGADSDEDEDDEPGPFNKTEVEVIVDEDLADFFSDELEAVVWTPYPSCLSISDLYHSHSSSRKSRMNEGVRRVWKHMPVLSCRKVTMLSKQWESCASTF